jgi:hypothetical protein
MYSGVRWPTPSWSRLLGDSRRQEFDAFIDATRTAATVDRLGVTPRMSALRWSGPDRHEDA